ncbi:hypothetical protein KC207_00935 [Phycicoccus sp. BSK3Z-2]|uniref:Peptide synthetase n=1 Tax=Phycicoccus avicenniae TaxID=2828860 RepID=A0A941D7C0_9MICO|nr:hypothetical protein [Phycicoccus avicenniae]MBR7741857.1 hypothetical protein [Phycicoccus avicenniae]
MSRPVSRGGRALGPFERAIDLYMERNPVQFTLVGELRRTVTRGRLESALLRLQEVHPLLAVRIEGSGVTSAFVPDEWPVPVTVLPEDTSWRSVAVREQQDPIDTRHGPLLRASLIPRRAQGSVVVLTFAHQIADGIGGLHALHDLVEVLAGGTVENDVLPEPMEDLMLRRGHGGEADDTSTDDIDPRMAAPTAVIPFEGAAPHVGAVALDEDATARLLGRCRSEGTTVHAALCAAASVALSRRGLDFVRVLSPIDLRRSAALPSAVSVRFSATRTGSEASDGSGFWDLARRTSDALSEGRAPETLDAMVRALVAGPPSTVDEAEAMITTTNAADVQVSNLGLARDHEELSAVWGPVQISQLRKERMLGVVTTGGRLRLTETTHEPGPGILGDLVDALEEQTRPGGGPTRP